MGENNSLPSLGERRPATSGKRLGASHGNPRYAARDTYRNHGVCGLRERAEACI